MGGRKFVERQNLQLQSLWKGKSLNSLCQINNYIGGGCKTMTMFSFGGHWLPVPQWCRSKSIASGSIDS